MSSQALYDIIELAQNTVCHDGTQPSSCEAGVDMELILFSIMTDVRRNVS